MFPVLLALGWFSTFNVRAGGEEVVVVYNTKMPESQALAEFYARKRNVPRTQIFGLPLSQFESISRKEYVETLQKPLLKKLEAEKLWRFGKAERPGTNGVPHAVEGWLVDSKIRYLALCYGVPVKITHDKELVEATEESARPEFRRNGAAVDSELATLPLAKQNVPLAGPMGNAFYTSTNRFTLHPTNGILLVARLDGPSPEAARGLVTRAIEAEQDGLWGRAYFDARGITDTGMKLGDDWIKGAAAICKQFGFETTLDEKPDVFPPEFPMSDIAFYAGWYREQVAGPFTQRTMEFRPGAFAYHLHSFSACTIREANRYWAGPLVARGATCTMGCVDEPYLGLTPDIGVFTARFLFFGFSFGEAAYACQPCVSWQTTVIGDPLYRPGVKNPLERHEEMVNRDSKLMEWELLRVVNYNLARNAPTAEMMMFLESQPQTKQSAVLSEKLADMCNALGKPSSTILSYQQALRLNPSPQQRIRLRLALGDKLAEQNREAEALEDFQKLLDESPAYAGRLTVLSKLRTLAEKLERKELVEKYTGEIKKFGGAGDGH